MYKNWIFKRQSWSTFKHNVKWDTQIGKWYRNTETKLGLFFLKTGRKLLKNSLGRCSWCGRDCGFDSVISKKGKRCRSLYRDCVEYP